jgi:hypothetical protein
MLKYKKGMFLKSKTSDVVIKLTGKHNGNGHWNSCKIGGSNKNHRVHETTLDKFYIPFEELKHESCTGHRINAGSSNDSSRSDQTP